MQIVCARINIQDIHDFLQEYSMYIVYKMSIQDDFLERQNYMLNIVQSIKWIIKEICKGWLALPNENVFVFIEHTLFIQYASIFGFSRKKLYPPCWGHQFFFQVDPPNFQSTLPGPPGISKKYPLFFINPPGNPCFSFNFWHTPWISIKFLIYPPGISIDVLNRGVSVFFLKSPL